MKTLAYWLTVVDPFLSTWVLWVFLVDGFGLEVQSNFYVFGGLIIFFFERCARTFKELGIEDEF